MNEIYTAMVSTEFINLESKKNFERANRINQSYTRNSLGVVSSNRMSIAVTDMSSTTLVRKEQGGNLSRNEYEAVAATNSQLNAVYFMGRISEPEIHAIFRNWKEEMTRFAWIAINEWKSEWVVLKVEGSAVLDMPLYGSMRLDGRMSKEMDESDNEELNVEDEYEQSSKG